MKGGPTSFGATWAPEGWICVHLVHAEHSHQHHQQYYQCAPGQAGQVQDKRPSDFSGRKCQKGEDQGPGHLHWPRQVQFFANQHHKHDICGLLSCLHTKFVKMFVDMEVASKIVPCPL